MHPLGWLAGIRNVEPAICGWAAHETPSPMGRSEVSAHSRREKWLRRTLRALVSTVGVVAWACTAAPPLAPQQETLGVRVLMAPVAKVSFVDLRCTARADRVGEAVANAVAASLTKAGFVVLTESDQSHAAVVDVKLWLRACEKISTWGTVTASIEPGATATTTIQDTRSIQSRTDEMVAELLRSPRVLALGAGSSASSEQPQKEPSPAQQANPGPAAAPTAVAGAAAAVGAANSATTTPAPAGDSEQAAPWVAGSPQRTAYALVIGIEHYRDLPPAVGAHADAEAMAALFRQTLGLPEANVRLALDDRATRSDLQLHLDWLYKSVPPRGRAYLYFSGHGSLQPGDGSAFIVPYDANTTEITASSIAVTQLARGLSQSSALEAFIVLDASFAGRGYRSVLPPSTVPPASVQPISALGNVALLTATTGAQEAGPVVPGSQGLLTKYLLDAVTRGNADTDHDGQLTLSELMDWVSPRVAREAQQLGREQSPSLTTGPALPAAKDIALVWGL